jgi:hypothetical protein
MCIFPTWYKERNCIAGKGTMSGYYSQAFVLKENGLFVMPFLLQYDQTTLSYVLIRLSTTQCRADWQITSSWMAQNADSQGYANWRVSTNGMKVTPNLCHSHLTGKPDMKHLAAVFSPHVPMLILLLYFFLLYAHHTPRLFSFHIFSYSVTTTMDNKLTHFLVSPLLVPLFICVSFVCFLIIALQKPSKVYFPSCLYVLRELLSLHVAGQPD